MGSAIKQKYPVGGNNYLYYTLSFNVKKKLNRKRKIGAGIDIFYDFSDKADFESKGYDESAITYMKPAIYAIHDFRLNKISIILNLGTYLYAFERNQNIGMIYDRVGLQYYFSNKVSCYVALKTHYANADCIEWGLNYSF